MEIEVKENDKYLEVKVVDDKLTGANSSNLKSNLLKVSKLKKNAICDMKNVEYVDSSGLSGLLIGDRLFKENDRRFILCRSSKKVLDLIKITKLDSIFTIIPTLSEARDFLLLDEIERSLND